MHAETYLIFMTEWEKDAQRKIYKKKMEEFEEKEREFEKLTGKKEVENGDTTDETASEPVPEGHVKVLIGTDGQEVYIHESLVGHESADEDKHEL